LLRQCGDAAASPYQIRHYQTFDIGQGAEKKKAPEIIRRLNLEI
jgi:hypothetical protein